MERFFLWFFYLFLQRRQSNEKEKTIYECPLKDKRETTIYPQKQKNLMGCINTPNSNLIHVNLIGKKVVLQKSKRKEI